MTSYLLVKRMILRWFLHTCHMQGLELLFLFSFQIPLTVYTTGLGISRLICILTVNNCTDRFKVVHGEKKAIDKLSKPRSFVRHFDMDLVTYRED